MEVVRHENISADKPRISHGPCFADQFVDRFIGENGFFVFRANGQENNNGAVEGLVERSMRGRAAFGGDHGESRRMGRNSSQQNLEGRPPCRLGPSDAAPTERRPPGSMGRDLLEGRPLCRPGICV